ncbi:MAG: hypothetical protein RIS70_1935, partial [Planctomycetota bacterium]
MPFVLRFRRLATLIVSGLIVVVSSWLPEAGVSGKERPNIVLLFADDQRADTIAAWGNAAIDTPHLDRLVRRG